jgi:hypothetical protein
MIKKLIGFCLVLAFLYAGAYSNIKFGGIVWQKPASEKAGPKMRFKTVNKFYFKPAKKKPSKIRIIVTLKNNGKTAVKAAVLKCAFYMKLKNLKTKKTIWAVPFALQERRISIIKPGRSVKISMPQVFLLPSLKRLKGSGFWVSKIKAEVMLEPRKGDKLKNNIIESIIPVIYD